MKEFHLDLHTGRPLTESDYIRSCIHTIALLRMSTQLLETCRGFKLTYHRRNSASGWLPTRIIRRCTVRKKKIYIYKNSCKEYRLCAVRSHVPRCRNVWRRCWNVCVVDIRISRGSLLFYSRSAPSLSPSDGLQLSSWVVSLFHCLVNLSVRKYLISYTWTGDCIGLCELLSSSSKSDHQTFNGYPFCFHNNRNKPQIIYMFCRLVT